MVRPDEKARKEISLPGIDKVDRFIGVAGGKGGVGKTTAAVHIVLALYG